MPEKTLWGYKPNGEASLFLLKDGESLPSGWSDKISVIEDPAKRTGEAVTAAAGASIKKPLRVSPAEDPDAPAYYAPPAAEPPSQPAHPVRRVVAAPR